MKKKILSILFIISFFVVKSQTYERFVQFDANIDEVTISKQRSCIYDISCEYSVDGRVYGTYRLSTTPTIIRFPRSYSKCQYRFYYSTSIDETGRIKPDIGIAVVDDIDIKFFDSGDLFSSYFDHSCKDEAITFFVINGSMLTSSCVCSNYMTVEPDELLHLFLSQDLSTYLNDKCGKENKENIIRTENRIMSKENLVDFIGTSTSNEIKILDMNGKNYTFNNLDDINALASGIYIIEKIENGIHSYLKLIK